MKMLIVSHLALILFCLGTTNASITHIGIGDELSHVSISGSDLLYMYGGIVHSAITCQGNSTATFYGGTVNGLDASLSARDFSEVYIYGGDFNMGVWAGGNSHVYIYGGQFGQAIGNGLETLESSIVDIFGYDFSYGYTETDSGEIYAYLSGKWQDSTPFKFYFGGYHGPSPSHINLHIVPEPCSMLLLGLGTLILRRRKA